MHFFVLTPVYTPMISDSLSLTAFTTRSSVPLVSFSSSSPILFTANGSYTREESVSVSVSVSASASAPMSVPVYTEVPVDIVVAKSPLTSLESIHPLFAQSTDRVLGFLTLLRNCFHQALYRVKKWWNIL